MHVYVFEIFPEGLCVDTWFGVEPRVWQAWDLSGDKVCERTPTKYCEWLLSFKHGETLNPRGTYTNFIFRIEAY